jgi:putative transposase
MAKGFVYLAVVLDWATRRVLSWRVSITMEAAFCVETLEDALARHDKPQIFNTDQGSQFTGAVFTGVLAAHDIKLSMDGKGAWRDNVFVERLWRSVKYEEVYLRAYDTVSEARQSIGRYLDLYNRRRPHSSLDGRTPDQAYFDNERLLPIRLAA